ncbi:hypothetical protein H2203_000134 [Taxawa tesnikishii (nom. ined.)]|nr:hypothetical protein H2203_000134 [Dothideales sp. JES 119]
MSQSRPTPPPTTSTTTQIGPASAPFTITPATSPADVDSIRSLFAAYATWLDLDLSFQSFSSELASLPGAYSPPNGCLLLARSSGSGLQPGAPLGCVALRPLASQSSPAAPCAEMKRLYVVDPGRGMGVGKALVRECVRRARGMGYRYVKLDSLEEKMRGAVRLYEGLGFRKCARYYETPLQGTVFLELDLAEERR